MSSRAMHESTSENDLARIRSRRDLPDSDSSTKCGFPRQGEGRTRKSLDRQSALILDAHLGMSTVSIT